MTEKTGVSLLKEFCEQQKIPAPKYEFVPNQNDPTLFISFVSVDRFIKQGSGRSKSEAKHSASEKLLDVLKRSGLYEGSSKKRAVPIDSVLQNTEVPLTNSTLKNNDAVGALTTLCLNHQLQSPNYEEKSMVGEPHRRQFTFSCKVGGMEFDGTASTKKEAKQIAAKAMLYYFEEMLKENASEFSKSSSSGSEIVVPWVIPLLELPSVEQVLDDYRRMRKPHIKPVVDGLRYRKNFFLKLPEANRREAQKILMDHDYLPSMDIVDLAFKALNLKYKIDSLPENALRFSLVDCDYDCVICGHRFELFEKIIQYLKTMLNVCNVDESIDVFT